MSNPARKLTGLQKVCKLYGAMKCGDTMMVWDYVTDEAMPETEMKPGSKRWMESERKRHAPHFHSTSGGKSE